MKEPWYVVPARQALRDQDVAGVSDTELTDTVADALPLLVLPPVAPRLPRRVESRKKQES